LVIVIHFLPEVPIMMRLLAFDKGIGAIRGALVSRQLLATGRESRSPFVGRSSLQFVRYLLLDFRDLCGKRVQPVLKVVLVVVVFGVLQDDCRDVFLGDVNKPLSCLEIIA
jgi:hypothetical protein